MPANTHPSYPSVTQVLAAHHFYDEMDAAGYANSEVGKHRGSALIKACDWLSLGQEPQWANPHPELDEFLDGFRLFLKEHDWRHGEHEREYVSHTDRLVTHPDLLGHLDGIFSNLEVKTGAKPNFVNLQTAGQNIAIGNLALPRYCLHLPGNGAYKLEKHTDYRDFTEFRVLLQAVWTRTKYQGRFWIKDEPDED